MTKSTNTAPKQTEQVVRWPMALMYCIVFIEGASVMAIELAGVKMIAPFYGTTLYVWAGVLSVTLAGLAFGYFLGGMVAARYSGQKTAPFILFSGALLVLLMPHTSVWFMTATSNLSIKVGPLLASLFFLMPPLICMGMISPIIIQLGTKSVDKAGKMAGTVYALSTSAGILMTLATGLYFLPEWGIKGTVVLVAFLLGSIAVISFFVFRNARMAGLAIVILLVASFAGRTKKLPLSDNLWVKHQSEGVLGQLTVHDYIDFENDHMRALSINGIVQTFVKEEYKRYSAWPYIHRIASVASIVPAGSKALVIGMAGGTLVTEFVSLGFDVDVVEIDERMPALAKRYFDFSEKSVNLVMDDGRHFLNTTTAKYDVVFIDVLNGEDQPFHMFTRQALLRVKEVCTPNALVLINFQGYLHGNRSLPMKSVLKTLNAAGLNVKVNIQEEEEEANGELTGDIHIYASPGRLDFSGYHLDRLNVCCKSFDFVPEEDLFAFREIDFSDGLVLDDNKPVLEKLNTPWTELWRKRKILDYVEQYSRTNYSLFR